MNVTPIKPNSQTIMKMLSAPQGNALFLILIAVALFAALSYAVTQSGRGGKGISDEAASLTAAQIMQILGQTEMDLQRFLIINDYDLEDIEMHKAGMTMTVGTNSCTTDACNLHHPDGGNAPVPLLPAEAISSQATACNYIDNNKIRPYYMIISIEGVGTDLPEVVLFYCGVSRAVCEKINITNGLRQAGDAPLGFTTGTYADGNYAGFAGGDTAPMAVTTPNQIGSASDARLAGQFTICSEYEALYPGATGGNYLMHVIRAR